MGEGGDEYTGNDWVECWNCAGEGLSHHECGDDSCACLNPENNVICNICNGEGGHYPNLTKRD